MRSIYTSVPVDKTAAIVTSQSGCEDEIRQDQIIENLKKKKRHIVDNIVHLKSKGYNKSFIRKKYGTELAETEKQLRYLKSRIKYSRHFHNFIIDIVKPKFTKCQWDMIVDEARRLEKQYHKNTKTQPKT